MRLAALVEAADHVCCRYRLRLICDRFLHFEHLHTDDVPWRGDREAGDIAACDIGVSWLPDDDWSRGKCGLKVLQYMAAGLPVVANPVGVQVEMVRDGVSGFLATTPAEWAAAVARLAADPALRRRLGAAGRALVEARYGVRAGVESWRPLLAASMARRSA